MAGAPSRWLCFPIAAVFTIAVALALTPQLCLTAGRLDKETWEKFYGTLVNNGTCNVSGEDSITDMFGHVLDKEFSDSDTPETPDKNSFNNRISDHQLGCSGDCICYYTRQEE